MTPDFDKLFDTIEGLRAKRDVFFREATSYSLASEAVVYASTLTLPAKVLWRSNQAEFRSEREGAAAVWTENDVASLVIWFTDLTGNRTATSADIVDWTDRFKGRVQEAARGWSLFTVDGQDLKARSVVPIERPDGACYALKVMLEAV